jgi:hypothetical protein
LGAGVATAYPFLLGAIAIPHQKNGQDVANVLVLNHEGYYQGLKIAKAEINALDKIEDIEAYAAKPYPQIPAHDPVNIDAPGTPEPTGLSVNFGNITFVKNLPSPIVDLTKDERLIAAKNEKIAKAYDHYNKKYDGLYLQVAGAGSAAAQKHYVNMLDILEDGSNYLQTVVDAAKSMGAPSISNALQVVTRDNTVLTTTKKVVVDEFIAKASSSLKLISEVTDREKTNINALTTTAAVQDYNFGPLPYAGNGLAWN